MSSIYYVIRGASTIAGWTPQGARHVLGSAISAVIYLGWPSKRRVTQLNMAQVAGRPVEDPYVRHLALASWRNYGRYAADFLNFPHLDMNAIEQQMHDLSEGDSWQSLMMSRCAYDFNLDIRDGELGILGRPVGVREVDDPQHDRGP